MKIAVPILLAVVYTAALLFAGGFSKKIGPEVSGNSFVNGQVNYKIILLLTTGVSLLVVGR